VGKSINPYDFCLGNLKGRENLGATDVNGKIILK
jgi:hypothetical protein